MNTGDISHAEDPVLRGALAALRRAAEMARQTAIQTNTDLILVQDGKIVRIPASELRSQMQPQTAPPA
ncbi:MAG: hypothetical protein NT069_11470 [Planctomycetota bacterium]|nr:hypothetical protein [Planctomycetota bacterium]